MRFWPRSFPPTPLSAAGWRGLWAVAALFVLGGVGTAVLAPPAALCRSCTAGGANGDHLVLRTSAVWREAAPGFGGLSGVIMHTGGARVTVLSDRARLFTADLVRDPASGAITGVGPARAQALLDRNGRGLTPFNSDAEDLATGADGTLIVAFEGLVRVAAYPAAPGTASGRSARPLHVWDRFAPRFGNTGFEAVTALPGGGILAIAEAGVAGVDPGPGTPAFASLGGGWQRVFDIPDPAGFAISGADLGPDGHLWLLERRLGWAGFVTRIRRFALTEGPTGAPPSLGPGETLLEARLGPRDNYEGITVWCTAEGRTTVSLISDDGFSVWQRTALIEFDLIAPQTPPCDPRLGPQDRIDVGKPIR